MNFSFSILESAGVNTVRRESYTVALFHHFGTDDQDGHAHSRRVKENLKKLKIIKMFPDQLMEETELTAGVLIESSRVQTFLRERKKKKNKKRKFLSLSPAARE